METPWGTSQITENHDSGFIFVSTARHGGFMIAKDFAEKHLSPAAIKRGEKCGDYLCYEEDCSIAIPLWELPQYWPKLFRGSCNPQIELLTSLSMWNADYLLEIGIEPEIKGYEFYKANRLDNEMRAAKHPDLIICAYGDWHKNCPIGLVVVETADGKTHFVTKESYQIRRPNLLSMCQEVK
jgi:hypothetical protein